MRRFDLGQEPLRDALDRSTVDERLAMMWPLAKEAWSVAGKPIAAYERSARVAHAIFPGLPLVGYERDAHLIAAKAAGFEAVHGLTVWVSATAH